MRLPNDDRAIIDERKIREYCLNPEHDEGKHKAQLFRELLGFSQEDAARLTSLLRQAASQRDAVLGFADRYGQRFVIDFEAVGPAGTVQLRSAWIVRVGERVPRLVTCYIM
jgi:hypothetical protein